MIVSVRFSHAADQYILIGINRDASQRNIQSILRWEASLKKICIFSLKYGKISLNLQRNYERIMAYFIKPIPTLTGDVAERFNERAAEAEANRGSVDFTEQVEVARSILEEAHL